MLKVLHLFLAILVLLGSAGMTVNRHFCMGKLKSVAIFGEAEKCHKEQTKKSCPFHPAVEEQPEGKKKGCCDDESDLVQIDDQEQTPVEALPTLISLPTDFPPQLFTHLILHPRPRQKSRYEHYHPPPLIPDPVHEFQVFRI